MLQLSIHDHDHDHEAHVFLVYQTCMFVGACVVGRMCDTWFESGFASSTCRLIRLCSPTLVDGWAYYYDLKTYFCKRYMNRLVFPISFIMIWTLNNPRVLGEWPLKTFSFLFFCSENIIRGFYWTPSAWSTQQIPLHPPPSKARNMQLQYLSLLVWWGRGLSLSYVFIHSGVG